MKLSLLLFIASIGWGQDATTYPSALVWMDGANIVFRIVPPSKNVPCQKEIKDALAKDQLFISTCGPSMDYGKVLAKDSIWTFHIDGKEYTLTGAQLAEAVKKAATPDK